jgi:feruloyl-CoA synthase
MSAYFPQFGAARVDLRATATGETWLSSPTPLGPYARCVGDWLEAHAARSPTRIFLAERNGVDWRVTSYAEARARVRALSQALFDLGLSRERPLLLLSDNGVDHALLQLAAMHVGVPAAPLSPAYSLVSRDFAKLRELARIVRPGAIYASDGSAYAAAIAALAPDVPLLVTHGAPGRSHTTLRELEARPPTDAVDRAFAGVGPDTIAKILFTSGSTGTPKGVVNTQRMLCSNQRAIALGWPFLETRPPVVVDWLPWSHTFGGNHNFNMVLAHGGTLYVDPGKPAPGLIDKTIESLREISPTLYFNVPRGFDALLPFLESDPVLRDRFFRELDLVFYAAAALPQSSWSRLEAVSLAARGHRVAMVSAWGSTETSPLATQVHFPIPRAGVIGLPAPGTTLKLVPEGDKLEMRVRGPNVTPGYWEPGGHVRPVALDSDGFLSTGDAGRLEHPAHPERGVVFDGRVAENFKLTSGTWVSVGQLRVALVGACAPLVQDAVLCGHDRDFVTALFFLDTAATRSKGAHELRAALRDRLREHNATYSASSTRIVRALVLTSPLSIDGGEITDKGYVNQRAVLTRRSDDVARLYASVLDEEIIVVEDGSRG